MSQYRVLGTLGDGHEGASVLAEKLAVSRPSITGVVDGLVSRGLATRDHAGGDRRRVDVRLTDEGRRVLVAADAEVERRLAEIAGYLGLERSDQAAAGLEPWRAALDVFRDARRAARKVANVGA